MSLRKGHNNKIRFQTTDDAIKNRTETYGTLPNRKKKSVIWKEALCLSVEGQSMFTKLMVSFMLLCYNTQNKFVHNLKLLHGQTICIDVRQDAKCCRYFVKFGTTLRIMANHEASLPTCKCFYHFVLALVRSVF